MAAEGGFLARMAASSATRAADAQKGVAQADLRASAERRKPARKFITPPGEFGLIAEIKRASPSAGSLATASLDPVEQARAYARGGATALSVLTEPDSFNGSLADLTAVAEAVPDLPVMRKDFLVDPYQVLEARAAGASGVLLIAGMVQPDVLHEMAAQARECGMFALVEAFASDDLADACTLVDAFPDREEWLLVGINSRDLKTLAVDPARFATLAPSLPPGLPAVAESGLVSPQDVERVAGLGYSLALVGTALMRSGEPESAVRAMLSAGRAGVQRCA